MFWALATLHSTLLLCMLRWVCAIPVGVVQAEAATGQYSFGVCRGVWQWR